MRRSISYSQNFLRPSPLLENLVATTSISAGDTVLDIGAGTGTLTKLLSRRCKEVIAIETDLRLAEGLQKSFEGTPNVTVTHGDFFARPLPKQSYKVLANIPFNRTSDVVHKLMDSPNPPQDSYLILQREAAEKFAGLRGRQSMFSVSHAPWFDFEVVHHFRASDFTPEPRVAIIMLRCRLRTHPAIAADHRPLYEDFVSYVFNHANPNILPAIQKLFSRTQFAEISASFGSHVTAKPTQLPPAAWLTLFQSFHVSASDSQVQLIRGTATRLQREASSIEKYHRTRLSKNWRQEAST